MGVMRKKSVLVILFLVLITLTSCKQASGSAVEETEKTILAGIGYNNQHSQYKGLERFKEIVEKKSKGALNVKIFHSGQLGDDRSMIESLQLGVLQVTIPSTAPLANFISEFLIFDYPFLFPNEEVADEVLDEEMGKRLLDLLPQQNLIGLAYWENGFRDLTNSTRPVSSMQDLKGLKVRTMESELHLSAFRKLGANPTPMAFGELFTAMQQGTVDGQENPISTIYLEGFYEVQKYISNTHHVYTPFIFLMSKPFYESLNEKEQKVVSEAAREAGKYQRKLNRKDTENYLQKLKDNGMEYTEITESSRKEMKKTIEPLLEQYTKEIGTDMVSDVYNAIENAQSP